MMKFFSKSASGSETTEAAAAGALGLAAVETTLVVGAPLSVVLANDSVNAESRTETTTDLLLLDVVVAAVVAADVAVDVVGAVRVVLVVVVVVVVVAISSLERGAFLNDTLAAIVCLLGWPGCLTVFDG